MLMTLGGAGLMAAAIALLRKFRIPEGQVSKRPEWVNIALSIAFTVGVTVGFMFMLKGSGDLVIHAFAN